LPSIPLVSDADGMGRAEERAAFQTDQGTGEELSSSPSFEDVGQQPQDGCDEVS